MISTNNVPVRASAQDEDFISSEYRELLKLAKVHYQFVGYHDIPWGESFVLWRHDCDCSLNRAVALARVEHEEGVSATYFLNPHSEFYNLNERSQHEVVTEIVARGHQLGLHFDSAFYGSLTAERLSELVQGEADFLEARFGTKVSAFSFHNPLEEHLLFDRELIGGRVNCYSSRFRRDVPYCSDSNGYWRFRRLRDVLEQASDSCLQVLTHPEWWQDRPMPPRQRVFRSVFGRARATMKIYDTAFGSHGRENLEGSAVALGALREALPRRAPLLDYLWMSGEMQALFVELWRLHEEQLNRLCKAVLRKEWKIPASEINELFKNPSLSVDGWRLFIGVFGQSWLAAAGTDSDTHRHWTHLRNQLIHGRSGASKMQVEAGCVYLCEKIAALAEWGAKQAISYDGLADLGTIGLPTYKTADGSITDRLEEIAGEIPNFPIKKWNQFKARVLDSSTARGIDE